MTWTDKEKAEEAIKLLQGLVDCGSIIYDSSIEFDVGECKYCGVVSYKEHRDSCEFRKAEEFLDKIRKEKKDKENS